MAVALRKGQEYVVGKPPTAALPTLAFGLGWDVKQSFSKGVLGIGSGKRKRAVDLDASCLLFDGNKELVDQVWFQQYQSEGGAVVHSGDNQSGSAPGADEIIHVNLSKLPDKVQTLVFTVTCFSELSFDKVDNAFISLVDTVTRAEEARFDLAVEGGQHTALVIGKLTRRGSDWVFTALGVEGEGHTFVKLLPLIKTLI